MAIRPLYHDFDSPGAVSPFDAAIVSILGGEHVRLVCPYISLAYLRRVESLSASWRRLTDVEVMVALAKPRATRKAIPVPGPQSLDYPALPRFAR